MLIEEEALALALAAVIALLLSGGRAYNQKTRVSALRMCRLLLTLLSCSRLTDTIANEPTRYLSVLQASVTIRFGPPHDRPPLRAPSTLSHSTPHDLNKASLPKYGVGPHSAQPKVLDNSAVPPRRVQTPTTHPPLVSYILTYSLSSHSQTTTVANEYSVQSHP